MALSLKRLGTFSRLVEKYKHPFVEENCYADAPFFP